MLGDERIKGVGRRAVWMDTLTLTQEEHGVDAAPRRLAAQIAARSAQARAQLRSAEGADRFGDTSARHQTLVLERDGRAGPAASRGRYFDPRAFCVDPEPPFGYLGREDEALSRLRDIAASLTGERRFRGDPHVTEPSRPNAAKDWRAAQAPSRQELEALAAEAFAALPDAFRRFCDGVAILVREFPEQSVLDELGVESAFDVMGLYEGVDLTRASVHDSPQDLNRILLYRRPILDYWCEHEESLGDLITHVLVHEIGHHFGLSDDEMAAIEAAVV